MHAVSMWIQHIHSVDSLACFAIVAHLYMFFLANSSLSLEPVVNWLCEDKACEY